MRPFFRLVICGAAIVAAIFVVPAADEVRPKRTELFEDVVVARGKGVEIRRSEVEDAFATLRANLAASGQPVPEDQRENIESRLVYEMVFTKLLLSRATEPDKAKAKEISGKYVEEMKARAPSPEAFKIRLRGLGLTPELFDKQVYEQAIRQEVIRRELGGKITVTDADLKKFYNDHPDRFQQPETVRISHILLTTQDTNTHTTLPPEARQKKNERAKKIRNRAVAGEDFTQLARETSEDPLVKDNSGEILLPKGKLPVPEFEIAAFSLRTNQISDVVESSIGFHIIKLHEKIPPKTVELPKVQEQLRDGLIQEAIQQQLPVYFETLRKEAGVEIKVSNPLASTNNPAIAPNPTNPAPGKSGTL